MSDTGEIDHAAYATFRSGLLKHIAVEEKILHLAAQGWRGGVPLPIVAVLKLDHGALTALLVPPMQVIIAALWVILAAHNELEGEPGGLY